MSLAAGTRLGPYEIVGLIGAGGMGEVYKARDTRLDRTVAVKVLPGDLSADPGRRARFDREAKTIASLMHPHICTLHDVGEHAGLLFLVMEHLEGESLAERLRKGPLPVHQALEMGAQIAEALSVQSLGSERHRRAGRHLSRRPVGHGRLQSFTRRACYRM
jgi:serine/threonine protein kinase